MKKTIAATLALLALSTGAQAADYSIGDVSCGVTTVMEDIEGPHNAKVQQYTIGYFSGISDNSKEVSESDMVKLTVMVCSANAAWTIQQAVRYAAQLEGVYNNGERHIEDTRK